MSSRVLFAAAAALLAPALVGCPFACTDILASSVTLSVVDGDGAPVDEFDVSFTVDGGDEVADSCPEPTGAEITCRPGGATVGFGWVGEFHVVVRSGESEATGDVRVEGDECGHPRSQPLTLVLE